MIDENVDSSADVAFCEQFCDLLVLVECLASIARRIHELVPQSFNTMPDICIRLHEVFIAAVSKKSLMNWHSSLL